MKTVTEYLRQGLLERAGIGEDAIPMPPFEVLWKSEWCPEFERHMRYRLVMGAFRYGRNFANRPKNKPQWDRLKRIIQEVEAYKKDGNDERLVDVANMAMLEFGEGNHPKKHFRSREADAIHCEERT
ncbi:MAG: hypothetical protein M0R74_18655 [Dehalococcoidia bacterium]|nr:hypothetical protein [Dehalococcoidia bacterium]